MVGDQVEGAGAKEGFCAYSSLSKSDVCRLNLWH